MVIRFLLTAFFIGAASAHCQNNAHTYDVNDPSSADVKDPQERGATDNVLGHYSFLESDGTKRFVDYSATHPAGYNPVLRNEPTGGIDPPSPVFANKPVGPGFYAAGSIGAGYGTDTPLSYPGLVSPVAAGSISVGHVARPGPNAAKRYGIGYGPCYGPGYGCRGRRQAVPYHNHHHHHQGHGHLLPAYPYAAYGPNAWPDMEAALSEMYAPTHYGAVYGPGYDAGYRRYGGGYPGYYDGYLGYGAEYPGYYDGYAGYFNGYPGYYDGYSEYSAGYPGYNYGYPGYYDGYPRYYGGYANQNAYGMSRFG